MKTYWSNLTPLVKHAHVFIAAAIPPIIFALVQGKLPTQTELCVAAGMGLAATCGLAIPSPNKPD